MSWESTILVGPVHVRTIAAANIASRYSLHRKRWASAIRRLPSIVRGPVDRPPTHSGSRATAFVGAISFFVPAQRIKRVVTTPIIKLKPIEEVSASFVFNRRESHYRVRPHGAFLYQPREILAKYYPSLRYTQPCQVDCSLERSRAKWHRTTNPCDRVTDWSLA